MRIQLISFLAFTAFSFQTLSASTGDNASPSPSNACATLKDFDGALETIYPGKKYDFSLNDKTYTRTFEVKKMDCSPAGDKKSYIVESDGTITGSCTNPDVIRDAFIEKVRTQRPLIVRGKSMTMSMEKSDITIQEESRNHGDGNCTYSVKSQMHYSE